MIQTLLAIDVGNSTTSFGFFSGTELVHAWNDSESSPTEDAFGEVAIASVVPNAAEAIARSIEARRGAIPIRILTHDDVPMKSRYDDRYALGLDRLLAAFAAHESYAAARERGVIVVDLGTATTYNCISSSGEFLGGAIDLGIGSTLRSIHERGAQLPAIEPERSNNLVATNTAHAITAGAVTAEILKIAEVTKAMTREAYPSAPLVVATGGLSYLLQGEAFVDEMDKHLVLRGIALAANRT